MRLNRYLLLIFFSFSCFYACKWTDRHTISYEEHFDPIFKKADSLYSFVDPKQALQYVDSAFQASPRVGIKDLYRKYGFKGKYHGDRHEFAEAMPYVDSMLWAIRDYSQDKTFSKEFGNAYFSKGYLYLAQGKYAEAFENYNKARHAIDESGDSCLMGEYTMMLGAVSNKQGKYLDAARYTQQSLQEIAHCPQDYRMFRLVQSRLDDAGIFFNRSQMPDSGLLYFRKALDFIHHHESRFYNVPGHEQFVQMAKGVIYGNMGDAYYQKGKADTAELLYRQSIMINTRQGFDFRDAQITQSKLANLYINAGRMKEAIEELDQLETSLKAHPNRETRLKWYQLQWEYFERKGEITRAYPYIKPYLALKDSLDLANRIPPVDINREYEHIRNQYNFLQLEKKEELTALYLLIAIIFSVLAGAFTLMLWNNWRRTRRFNARISKQNEEMQLAMSSLIQSQKENTRIIKIVAHDLRSPVASTISVTRLMLENGNLSSTDREMLELMKTSSEQSMELIGELLNMNNTAEEMKKEPVALHNLLRYCVDLLQFQAAEKRQQLFLDAQPITVNVNSEKIWRVISNLIVNAIKFSPGASDIVVCLKEKRHTVEISVQDQGIGIPDHLKDKIFDMFTDAKRPGTQGEQSYGIGLSIAKQIIEAHQGHIWFESTPGHGTTFYVELPV